MRFTGERFIPTEQGKIRLEHYHRYAIVMDVVKGKDVLDVACGEGYGSSLIADTARLVTGVDISDEAVLHADSAYRKPNLSFRQGSATDLKFADASFDIVISFETIEHLSEQAKMLAEIRRVLRPAGLLVISSPNRPVYSEESGEHNEFHVKELDFNELDVLLKVQFPAIQYFGQRIMMGSVVQPLIGGQAAYRVWHDDGVALRSDAGNMLDPVYFVAVCGADKANLPNIDMSVLYPDKLDLVKHYVGFAKWAKSQDVLLSEGQAQIANLNQVLSESNNAIAQLKVTLRDLECAALEQKSLVARLSQTLAERNEEIKGRDQEIKGRDEEIASLHKELDKQLLIKLRMETELHNFDRVGYMLTSLLAKLIQKTSAAFRKASERMFPKLRTRRIIAKQSELLLNSKIFDSVWYLDSNPDVAAACINPLEHYLRSGATEGRNPSPMFYSRWYLEQNPDVAAAGLNPLVHYLNNGAIEGRNPSPMFYSRWYLEQNPDVAAAGLNPLTHFLHFGAIEGRQPKPQPFRDVKVLCEHLLRINRAPVYQIHFEVFDTPKVSVIIPIYNKIEYTLQCLESICRFLPEIDFEIIVVDDCSTDDSAKQLRSIDGLRIVTNKTNQGFIRSCNIGAKESRGKYLHFLNNDTEVTAGWLDELYGTFQEFPGTGFVGSKLVYPDGSLQEAGGIIWQDGSAWNFGRNQDPQLPLYNYAREVDYCSGASIMVPKVLFQEMGCFDEHYLPAYCEDADLALKIRDSGYRVIYQPMSKVVHYEGITSGTDTTQGAKAYQVENLKKLYSRWKDRLSNHQAPGTNADSAKDRTATRRVLVLDHCTPTPNQDAGSLITYNMLLLLREMKFQVTFIPEDNFHMMPGYTPLLQRNGIEALYSPYVTSVEQHLKECGDRYDLLLLFRPMVAKHHLKNIRHYCPRAKVLFHTVDLHFLRMSREAALRSNIELNTAAEEMKQLEFSLIRDSDATIVVSERELELLKPEFPDSKLYVFPLIIDIQEQIKPFSERKDIVFIGGYQHLPNVDAVKYFVSEIMPLLRKSIPGVNFNAVGAKPPAEILALATDDVKVLGFVEALNPLLDEMRVSVAPLRFGAGIKGKIGSAMAVGLPVVATTLAAEGMALTNGNNIIVADGAEQFADAVACLYKDEALWKQISSGGLEFAENTWGAEAAWKALIGILAEIEIQTDRGPHSLSLYSGMKVD